MPARGPRREQRELGAERRAVAGPADERGRGREQEEVEIPLA